MEVNLDYQTMFNAALAIVSAGLGWWARVVWDRIRELEKSHADLRVAIADQYVKKNEFTSAVDKIEAVIASGLARVFDKLDGKADK